MKTGNLGMLLVTLLTIGCALDAPSEPTGTAGAPGAAGSAGSATSGSGGTSGDGNEGGNGATVVGGGQLCDGRDVVCVEGFYCDTVSRRCVEPLGAGGEGGQPGPSITCRHGAIKITGIGPVELSEVAISLWLPWEPHETGGNTALFLDGIVFNSSEDSGVVGWRNTIEDIGDDQMAFHLVPATNEYRDPIVVPADELSSQAWRAHIGCDDCESDALEPTECVLRVGGDTVAAWP